MGNEPINLFDFEVLAKTKVSTMAWDYFASGAQDEITLGENQAAYRRLRLHNRVLVDVSKRSQATTVLGEPIRTPVLIAPTALQKLAHEEGELATARAASSVGTIMSLSTLSNTPVEEVSQAGPGPVWFQLYVYRDREATKALVQRAEAAGCSALVLTVDAPLLGRRERDVQNRFALPPHLTVANLPSGELKDLTKSTRDSGLAEYFASLLDPSLTWDSLDWLASITHLPIVVKGIVRPDDAERAIEHGAAAIVVSNHGGRQLDTAPATIEVLPAIFERVASRLEVLVDGGIRRGTDVVKALASGARAVLLGRPILWGLAVAGQAGVERVLGLLMEEIDLAMALCGCTTIEEIVPDLLG